MVVSSRRTLAESPNFVLAHSFESVVVIDKRDGSTRDAGDHYGDPAAGIITSDERWFVSVGEGVQCLCADGRLVTLFRRGHPPLGPSSEKPAWFVTAIRADAGQRLRISVDPHSVEGSEWSIDLATEALTKVA